MPKKKTLKYWKTKIDKVFHEYIRRRDADNNTGYCNCITCQKKIHFTESDAGHFISRGKLIYSLWDSRNVYTLNAENVIGLNMVDSTGIFF